MLDINDIQKLEKAQDLLSEVFFHNQMNEIGTQLASADSCLSQALSLLYMENDNA